MNDQRRVGFAFVALALMWGTSFLFIKLAVQTLGPLTLVGARLLVGWVTLIIIMWAQGLSFPRDRRLWGHFMLMGVMNTALPFFLFSWAESGPNGVDSSVAAVLNSTVPLFTILLASAVFRIEAATFGRILGLLLGFVGVLLIFGRTLLESNWGGALPLLACTFAALCYAISSIYIKTFIREVNPIVMATCQLLLADIVVWIAAFALEDMGSQSWPMLTIVSILWLGVLGSALAYICYFYVLGAWGPTRATLVTYLIPIVGVIAGVLVLSEPLTGRLIIGGLLILSGVGAVNSKWSLRPKTVMTGD